MVVVAPVAVAAVVAAAVAASAVAAAAAEEDEEVAEAGVDSAAAMRRGPPQKEGALLSGLTRRRPKPLPKPSEEGRDRRFREEDCMMGKPETLPQASWALDPESDPELDLVSDPDPRERMEAATRRHRAAPIPGCCQGYWQRLR